MFFLVDNCTVFAKTDSISILGNCCKADIPIFLWCLCHVIKLGFMKMKKLILTGIITICLH